MRSKDDLNFALKTTLWFSWFEPSLRTYCRQSLVRLSSNGGSFAATHRLVVGDVLKAPDISAVHGSEYGRASVDMTLEQSRTQHSHNPVLI